MRASCRKQIQRKAESGFLKMYLLFAKCLNFFFSECTLYLSEWFGYIFLPIHGDSKEEDGRLSVVKRNGFPDPRRKELNESEVVASHA
jgi:hypothetical protein